MFKAAHIKKDFPIFTHHPDLVYLDSTATSLKPRQVLAALNGYYEQYSANVFRGIYQISEQATAAYEGAREKVAQFIGSKPENLVFVRNASEGLNLVLYAWARQHVGKGDEVMATLMEHHSNFVPWQQLALHKNAQFTLIDVNDTGLLDEKFIEKISKKTKLVALTHVSNVLGTINPIKELIAKIKRQNPHIVVVVDAAQSVPHMAVDVAELGCDFLAFSSHKMLGPTGVGAMWIAQHMVDQLKPFQYGGEMIKAVYADHTDFTPMPHLFEAGTPHIAGVIGFGAAVDYLSKLGMDNVRAHEKEITEYALKEISKLSYIKPIGPQDASKKGGVIAFTMDKVHAHDVSQVLDMHHIATRSGHHCAMPLHLHFKLPATCRASFYVYTTKEDVDKLVEGLEKVKQYFQR